MQEVLSFVLVSQAATEENERVYFPYRARPLTPGLCLQRTSKAGAMKCSPAVSEVTLVGLLLGTLFRLCGIDISIFPHAGGRFPFSVNDAERTTARLREPLSSARGEIAASLPAPAGGMHLERVPELHRSYGTIACCWWAARYLDLDPSSQTPLDAF